MNNSVHNLYPNNDDYIIHLMEEQVVEETNIEYNPIVRRSEQINQIHQQYNDIPNNNAGHFVFPPFISIQITIDDPNNN